MGLDVSSWATSQTLSLDVSSWATSLKGISREETQFVVSHRGIASLDQLPTNPYSDTLGASALSWTIPTPNSLQQF